MWPLEYTELKHIENLLVCGICYEYMETTVITACSHNYCSLCIRKYLHYKTQCPACFSETFEKDLRKNKVLDEIISHFSHVKEKLKKCLRAQTQFVQSNKDGSVLSETKVTDNVKEKTPLNKRENKVISGSATVKIESSPSASIRKDFSSPSTSGNPRIPLIFTPKRAKGLNASIAEDTPVVICPVCKVTVSETNINRHLDDCLKRETIKDRPVKVQPKRKPLPKLVFSLMKDGVIRKKLKELGLSSQGDRKVLEARLQRYTVLYNAECDKSNPRSIAELLRQCEDEENLERNINKTSTFINRLQVNRNTEENIIDNERKKYLEANKDSFVDLIKRVKRTETPKKLSARRSILDHCVQSEEDVPQKHQAVVDNSNDSIEESETSDFRPINYDDICIPDSDSDTSCPLQMYSSVDPLKFVNAELSPDDKFPQNKSSPDVKKKTSQEQLKSPCNSSVKVRKDTALLNTDLNIPTFSDKILQSRTGNTSPAEELNYTSTESCCGSPKIEMRLQRRGKMSRRGQTKRTESVKSSVDSKERETLEQPELDDEVIDPEIIQDSLSDEMSSNDGSNFRYNYGKSRTGLFNDGTKSTLFLEKENISSSPECGTNRSARKRGRDPTLNKFTASARSEITKSSKLYSSETEESVIDECVSGIPNDHENGGLRKKIRLRKPHDTSSLTEESTPAVRKSTRIRYTKRNVP